MYYLLKQQSFSGMSFIWHVTYDFDSFGSGDTLNPFSWSLNEFSSAA